MLSKSRHYDWKLRAIKTTLYVAGGMKRDAPELSEDKVLLRALRDFNLGKVGFLGAILLTTIYEIRFIIELVYYYMLSENILLES